MCGIVGFTNHIDNSNVVLSKMMDKIASPTTTIPGIGRNMGAMIISEIGDFSRFSSPDKILRFAALSARIYH